CQSAAPPVLSEDAFYHVFDTVPVYVPCSAVNAYQTADYWNTFSHFVGMPDTTYIFDTVCYGEIYRENGFVIDQGSGIYYRTQITANNCDSIICITLSVYDSVRFTAYAATVCEGNTYSDNNFTNLTQGGVYYDTLQNINGCDSIICLNLSVYDSVPFTVCSSTVCYGNAYSDNNFTNLTQEGVYYDTLQNINGCDSIIELTLIVNPIYFVPDTAAINPGEVYNFNGKILTLAGIYYDTLQTIYGCDSIIELDLTYETSTIETEKTEKIRVYPNPTTGQLTIENKQLTINAIEIVDVMGKNVYLSARPIIHSPAIDVSYLPVGIYYLRITTETGIITQKIIKY
ncbi:MAG: T9SS type A sorting domain-containing protein, partial [Bacteroidales bacterium]|nr:T9SS type A sorting domain-containing protein [Bacteroidales bacterium]